MRRNEIHNYKQRCKGWLRTCRKCKHRYKRSPKGADGKINVVKKCPECGECRRCIKPAVDGEKVCGSHGAGNKKKGTRRGKPKKFLGKGSTIRNLLTDHSPLKTAVDSLLDGPDDLTSQREVIAINYAMMAQTMKNIDLGTVKYLVDIIGTIKDLTDEPYNMPNVTKEDKKALGERTKMNFIKIRSMASIALEKGNPQLSAREEFRKQAMLNKNLVDSSTKVKAANHQMIPIEVVLKLLFDIITASEINIDTYIDQNKKAVAARSLSELVKPIFSGLGSMPVIDRDAEIIEISEEINE